MKIETTLEQMREDYNWQQAWAYADDGLTMDAVAEVVGSVDGARDDRNWAAVMRLKDGRYAYLSAGCDYTGWD